MLGDAGLAPELSPSPESPTCLDEIDTNLYWQKGGERARRGKR